jgi:hypothetical protein
LIRRSLRNSHNLQFFAKFGFLRVHLGANTCAKGAILHRAAGLLLAGIGVDRAAGRQRSNGCQQNNLFDKGLHKQLLSGV